MLAVFELVEVAPGVCVTKRHGVQSAGNEPKPMKTFVDVKQKPVDPDSTKSTPTMEKVLPDVGERVTNSNST